MTWAQLATWLLISGVVGFGMFLTGKREGYAQGFQEGYDAGREYQRAQGIEHLPDILDDGNRREEQPRDPEAPRARIHESRWTNGYW